MENAPVSTNSQNPYVGPRPFEEGETLYGRTYEVRQLQSLLIAERIVMLYSPSGAGKTSLLQAALIPRLVKKRFEVLPVVRVNQEPPPDVITNRYVYSVLDYLEKPLPLEEQIPLTELATLSLTEYLDRRRAVQENPKRMVLIFDQFEEILTIDPTKQAPKKEFFTQVGEALHQRWLWAVFSLREDYIAGLDPYLRPIPTRLNTTFRLTLLDKEAAREAMQGPAQEKEVTFTDAAAQQLVNDLCQVRVQQRDGRIIEQPGNYVEPVQLQVVCDRLWENRFKSVQGSPPKGSKIEATHISSAGDVDSALAGYYAERVKDIAAKTTGVSEHTIRDWCDTKLITAQNIRGQVMRGTEQSQGLANQVIEALVDAHLVRAEDRRGVTWYELAHDRLIKPIKDDNTAWEIANLSLLQRQVGSWVKEGRSDNLLLRGDDLTKAERWAEAHADELEEVEAEYLTRSLTARNKARLTLYLAIAATIVSVLAFIAFVAASNSSNQANEARQTAQAQAIRAQTAEAIANQQKNIAEAASTDAIIERNKAATAEATAIESARAAEAAKNDQATLQAALNIRDLTATAEQNERDQLRSSQETRTASIFMEQTASAQLATAQASSTALAAAATSAQETAEAANNQIEKQTAEAIQVAIQASQTAAVAEATATAVRIATQTAVANRASAMTLTNINLVVSSGQDDAEERIDTGNMYIVSTDLELAYDTDTTNNESTPRGKQVIGIRFQNVDIPRSARIERAYIEFTASPKTDSRSVILMLYGEASDNAPTFTEFPFDISHRNRTNAGINWDVPAWNAAAEKHQTPSLANVIQEIVNRSGWQRGNALAFIISASSDPNQGVRTATSFESGLAVAPKLYVEYRSEIPVTETVVVPTRTPTPSATATLVLLSQQKIVYASNRETLVRGDYDLYSMAPDGSDRIQLTFDLPIDPDSPSLSYSPVTEKIVFATKDRDSRQSIFAMNPDGSEKQLLTGCLGSNWQPSISRDGSQVVFASNVPNCDGNPGNIEIYSMNFDGSEVKRLTNHVAKDEHPAWSPDGQYIVFASRRDTEPNEQSEIWLMDAAGTKFKRLTDNDEGDDVHPVWSPNGRKIAYTSVRGSRLDIYVMDVENLSELIDTPDSYFPVSVNLTNSPEPDNFPAWSLDGNWVAFVRNRNGIAQIFRISADGDELVQINTNDNANNFYPLWINSR